MSFWDSSDGNDQRLYAIEDFTVVKRVKPEI